MGSKAFAAVATLIMLLLALEGTSHGGQEGNGPFLRGTGEATFSRLSLVSGPALGADTPMTTILSVRGFGDVLMYCYFDDTPTPITAGGFAFRNTTSQPLVVSGVGTLQPGERTGGGQGNVFQVTSGFDHPDRIALVTVSLYVEGNLCRGHAHAIAQR